MRTVKETLCGWNQYWRPRDLWLFEEPARQRCRGKSGVSTEVRSAGIMNSALVESDTICSLLDCTYGGERLG